MKIDRIDAFLLIACISIVDAIVWTIFSHEPLAAFVAGSYLGVIVGCAICIVRRLAPEWRERGHEGRLRYSLVAIDALRILRALFGLVGAWMIPGLLWSGAPEFIMPVIVGMGGFWIIGIIINKLHFMLKGEAHPVVSRFWGI